MKILYILADPDIFSLETNKVGGHIAHIIGVVDALQKKEHKVIVCSHDKIPFYDSQTEYRILKSADLKIPKVRVIWRHYVVSNQLLNTIRDVRPDMVYVRWSLNLFWNRIFRRKDYDLVFECNTPFSMFLGRDIPKVSNREKLVARYVDAQICKNADVILAVSKEVKSFLVENIPLPAHKKIVLNPNGVDSDKFKPDGEDYRKEHGLSKGNIVVGFSGSFKPWHGIETLINAFHTLNQKEYSNVKLLLIGTGDENYIRHLKGAATGKRTNDIIFTGAIPFDKMPAYLRTCDILASPQIPAACKEFHESPTKLFEYMAAGRAIVASNTGQIAEIIKNGHNGILFEPGNVNSLASKLKLLIRHEPLRKRLSGNARVDAAAKHSWESHVDRFIELVKAKTT